MEQHRYLLWLIPLAVVAGVAIGLWAGVGYGLAIAGALVAVIAATRQTSHRSSRAAPPSR